jgi:hypothetical protein
MRHVAVDTMLTISIRVETAVEDNGTVEIEKITIADDGRELSEWLLHAADVQAIKAEAIANAQGQRDKEEANAKARTDTRNGLVSVLMLIGMHLANGGSGHA